MSPYLDQLFCCFTYMWCEVLPHFLIIYKHLKISWSVLHIKVMTVYYCFLLSRTVLDLSLVASNMYIDSLKLGIQLIIYPFLPHSYFEAFCIIVQNMVVLLEFLRHIRDVCFSPVVQYLLNVHVFDTVHCSRGRWNTREINKICL